MPRHLRTSPVLMLLLAIFLAMQTFTAAHAATHGLVADPDQCSTCLRAGQYKSAAPSTVAATAAVPTASKPVAMSVAAAKDNTPLARRARSPPSPATV